MIRAPAVAAALMLASTASAAAQQNAEPARSAFARAAAVFQHPRCTNCHNRGEGPRQGDAQHVHQLNVRRGPDGRGEGAGRCTACHRATNTTGGAIPGAADWRMPRPGNAGWDGLSPAEICAALKDPQRNAGLPLDQLVEHLEKDPLVNWAWEPGGIRKKPPLAKADFIALMRTWRAGGAPCPS